MSATRLLVIGAHAADFVWRAGGAIALTTTNGGTASVLSLSYGERGESGELWKEEGRRPSSASRRSATARRSAQRKRSARSSTASTSAITHCRSTTTR